MAGSDPDPPVAGASLYEFLRAVPALKATRRQGWVRDGVREAESVADHTLGMALLALVVPLPPDVDRDHLIRLVLVHDLAEAKTGDLMPGELPKAEKHAREAAALDDLTAHLPNGAELRALWLEYEHNTTPAARFAHDLDKLEMLLQALAYETAGNPGPLDSFWEQERNRVTDPALATFLQWLEGQRPSAARSEADDTPPTRPPPASGAPPAA